MPEVSRRSAISLISAGAAVTVGSAVSDAAMGQTRPPAGKVLRKHEPKSLPFNPAKLEGLSERLISSHWQNNYVGSVNALNMVEERLAEAMADAEFPPLIYGDIKREQLHRTGSVVLHELYFGNLGGNGSAAGGVKDALSRSFGSFDAWEAEFRRTATALAGGSGWCVLALNAHTGDLCNYWMWDHMHAPATGIPLLVLDMYEHSYHMDYGSAAARYIDAFMRNANWEEVDRRYAGASQLYRGKKTV
jgi:superoxide dismutase, Fe-Mn family